MRRPLASRASAVGQLCLLCLGALSMPGLAGCDETALPEILVVPEFVLTSQRGDVVSSSELRGHVWVASFVFTSCRDVCPLITNAVANLHRRVADPHVRFVSFSVDPEVDTPQILAEYAQRYGADTRWVFLTGDVDDVRRVVTDGFHVPMSDPREDGSGYDISHGEQLLLVDQRGVLRGQYGTDREAMDRLARDIASLTTD